MTDDWPTNLLNNQKKQLLVWGKKYCKNSDKSKYVYSGYGIAFDVVRSWSFDNDFAKSVINFDIDNSSSSHTDN